MSNSLKHKDLVHLLDDNGAFTEKSIELNDYLRDFTELKLGAGNVYYFGYTKPFQQVFVENSKPNAGDGAISVRYYDGTSFVDVPNLFDDTKDLKRSGFIRWEFQDLSKIRDSWKTTNVDGKELYWIQVTSNLPIYNGKLSQSETGNSETVINISADNIGLYSQGQEIYIDAEQSYHTVDSVGATSITISPALALPLPDNEILYSLCELQGLNVLYCDDQDLLSINPRINDYKLKGQNSFVNFRVEARNHIISALRTGGFIKNLGANSDFLPNSSAFNVNALRQFNKWDILDISEIREAAKYLTLAKIFFEISENVEDKAYARYRDYEEKYGMAFKVFYLTLDYDDDGETDDMEMYESTSVMVHKT